MKFCESSSSLRWALRVACCLLRITGQGLSPIRSGLVLLFLVVATVPVAAQEEEPPLKEARSIVDGVPADYSLMAQSAFLELYLHPTSAQIGIRDLRAGRVWLSNPALPHPEKVPESLRAPFDSVFFAFFTKELSTQMRREVSMAHVPEPEIEPTAQGATVHYEMEALGFSMSVRYELGPDYLDVTVDEAGLEESADHLLVAIDILPYLGATPNGMETPGYFVLPDGPGALVYLDREQPSFRKRFSVASYGPDRYSFARPSQQRTPLPAFGVVQPPSAVGESEAAVLGVITTGAGDSSLEATIGTEPLSFNTANPRFIYRRLNEFPISEGEFKGQFETKGAGGDRAVRYFFLAGEEANWVGMAHRLRQHLIEDRGVPRLHSSLRWAEGNGQPVKAALRLRLVMGATKPGLVWRKFVKATSFAEAAEITALFHAAGMTDLDLVLVGWQKDGYEGSLPVRWPPDRRLGGERGLASLVEEVHALGVRLFLEDDYTLGLLRSRGFFPVTDVMIQPNLLPISDMVPSSLFDVVPPFLRRGLFFLNADFASDRYLERDLSRFAELDVDGLELRWAGELVLKDANPWHGSDRSEAPGAWRRMLQKVVDANGSVAVQGGNDYVLGIADTVTQFPLDRSNYVYFDETVPFYPIATHGLVRLYGRATNLDKDPEKDFLKRLEYGLLPVYELTYRQPIVLARTTYSELYSSHYLDWLERAAAEYEVAVGQLGHTVDQFIVGYRQLAPHVFETQYEDGTRVIVNYGEQTYVGADVRVKGLGYAVLRRK